jgi:hypothetical protein
MTRREEIAWSGAVFFVCGAVSMFNFMSTYYRHNAVPSLFVFDFIMLAVNYCWALWCCRRIQRPSVSA